MEGYMRGRGSGYEVEGGRCSLMKDECLIGDYIESMEGRIKAGLEAYRLFGHLGLEGKLSDMPNSYIEVRVTPMYRSQNADLQAS